MNVFDPKLWFWSYLWLLLLLGAVVIRVTR